MSKPLFKVYMAYLQTPKSLVKEMPFRYNRFETKIMPICKMFLKWGM